MLTYAIQTTHDDTRFGTVDVVAGYTPDIMWDPPGGCPPGGSPRYGCGFVEARAAVGIVAGFHFDGNGDMIPYHADELFPSPAALYVWYDAHGCRPKGEDDEAIARAAAAAWQDALRTYAETLLREAAQP